jgi:MFS family permease
MAFIHSAASFYLLRLLLGIAEAGFFPGVLYYLTYWVPASERARLIGTFMTAIPVSTALSAPLSSAILSLDGRLGLAGWQWLFLSETLPSLILGIITLRYLPDRPAQAAWLTAAERTWLTGRLAAEHPVAGTTAGASVLATLANPRVLALCACYCGADLGLYGVVYWIPQIFSGAGLPGYAVALPYAVAAFGMIAWSRRSDRRRERTRHIALASLVGFLGLALSACVHGSAPLSLLAFTLGVSGTLAMLPVFWTLPAAILRGAAAAGGIALINAVGNLGSFAGPYAVGWIKEATGSFTLGLIVVAVGVLLSGVIAVLVGHDARAEHGDIPTPPAPVHNPAPAPR